MPDDEFGRYFIATKMRKAGEFAARHALARRSFSVGGKRGAFYFSLSLVLAAGVGGIGLASAVAYDAPPGTQVLAEEARASVSHIAHEIVAGVGAVADTAWANIPHPDLGENLSYSRTAQTAQAASADNGGIGSWIGGWLCRIFGNCSETIAEEAPSAQAASAALVLTEGAPSSPVVSTTTSTGSTTLTATSSPHATIVNNYITQPVIERTVQTVTPASRYVTQAELAAQLNNLQNTFGKTIYGTTYPAPATNYGSGGVFNAIALSNKIDNLSGTNLSNITVSGVSGLTDADIPDGITASNYLALTGGTLSGDLTLTGNLTVSGAQTLSGAITIPYLTATSTSADSSFIRLTATNATTTNATSTNFSVLGSITAPYYTATSSTASQLPYASSTAITVSGTASTSALVASNSFTFGSVSGFLKATAGAVSNALVNLASDVSGILPVGNGGTGWGSFTSGAIPYGNGSSALATTTSGTAGYVLAYLNGVPTWTATTTFSGGLTYAGGNVTLDNTGAWTGTFDGQEGSYYLNAANLTNFGTPFYTLFSATTTDALAQGSTNKYYADSLVQSFVHASSTIPKTYTANAFSALQSFDSASSTRLSVFDRLYVGGTATTTIFGNATSTFGAGIESTYLNITGTAATSTFASGIDLSAGCFSILGTCVGGASSQWTTSGSNIYFNTGSVLIGTTTAGRTLTVFNTAANAQQRISYDSTRYAEFYVDASGDLQLSATGKNLRALDANLYLCDGGACPTTPVQGYPTFASQGNLVAGGTIYAAGFGPATCPSGMIPVPPSPADGTNGFCVDKYEAQSSSGNEVSVQGGSPWVSVTQTSARAECIRAGKHLITEKEWQAIAHNVENVGWNWNGGVAGTNQMSDGHSDNSPASALATAADASACSGTGQTCDLSTWDSQRRVYKLSNNEYIWDFGGNVWEWVDQTVANDYPIVNSAAAGWQTCSTSGDGICGNTRTTNDQWYRGGFSTIAGFSRGGNWTHGANDGAFALNLGSAPSAAGTNIGFRCSR